MADNYLENRMEEYRRGSLGKSYAARKSPSGQRIGTLSVKLGQLRVFVTGGLSETGRGIVRSFADAGCKVAFVSTDVKAGREFSQLTGSRFYPVKSKVAEIGEFIDDALRSWGGIDVMVAINDDEPLFIPENLSRVIIAGENPVLPDVDLPSGATVNGVSTNGVTPSEIASFVIYLCLPTSTFINHKIFDFSER